MSRGLPDNNATVGLRAAFTMCLVSALIAVGLFAVFYGKDSSYSGPVSAQESAVQNAPVAPVVTAQNVTRSPQKVPANTVPASGLAPRVFAPHEQTNISVYENVNRSVVNIDTTARVRDPFSMFSETAEGSGSGSIIDLEGHVLTNHHVISGAEVIGVTLADGNMYEARLIGSDPQNDIAILKIDAPREKLSPVRFGESSDLKVGQQIFAIGNPFGLERTLTTGIISSLNRTLPASKNGTFTKGIIQIDAALNQGNSGGPLLDTQGKLIGMNTAIANPSRTGENTGVGFSIPVNTIRRVIPELIEFGRVIRADLGIAMTFSTTRGLGLAMLNPDGPGQRAGLRGIRMVIEKRRQGPYIIESRRRDLDYADTLLAIDDKPIDSLDDLQTFLDSKKPGERVIVKVLREEKVMDIPVVLGEE